MKKYIFPILIVLLLCPVTGFSAIPGKYEVIIPFSPPAAHSLDQVTIHEVFAFDCGHCYNFHRTEYQALKKKFNHKVKFVYHPIGWRGPDPGRLFFIAEQKGKGEPVMMMVFDFIFNKGLGAEMFNRDKLQFVARLNGLEKEFDTMMDAPEIVQKMNDSMQYAKDKKIDSTPTLVVEDVLIPERTYANLVTIINALLKEPVL
ncbi:thioredoxin domain-containing protein [bacterium]|nr:thioredoxin domain-containing protein [bacterium]